MCVSSATRSASGDTETSESGASQIDAPNLKSDITMRQLQIHPRSSSGGSQIIAAQVVAAPIVASWKRDSHIQLRRMSFPKRLPPHHGLACQMLASETGSHMQCLPDFHLLAQLFIWHWGEPPLRRATGRMSFYVYVSAR